MTKRILESGLYFDPPDGYFRLESRPYFADQFKRRGMCEMDFGWWASEEKIVHLLELKDYSSKEMPENLVEDLVQKATDCLLLLGSMYYDLPHAPGIRNDLPTECHQKPTRPGGIRLTFVLKAASPDRAALLQPMRDKLKNKLAGRLHLLDLKQFTEILILDQWMAAQMGFPIQFDEEADSMGAASRRSRNRR